MPILYIIYIKDGGNGYKTKLCVCKKTRFCAMHQYEIAEELHLSRANINKIFSNLQMEGYISMITRGRWKVSDDALHFIEVTRQL